MKSYLIDICQSVLTGFSGSYQKKKKVDYNTMNQSKHEDIKCRKGGWQEYQQ